MSDRTAQAPSPAIPVHAHPLRDVLMLDLLPTSQIGLMERFFDRIERGAAQ
ncbi:hypothetical protein [Aestuariivita boseongensis]|uniref:hypothetical protein n=1 Tax=Aestuariivita boseongensis TaxID=1470562 RepID=UPI0012FA1DDF|nr:hypothetical protein [Aestuariivita boseongensis]